jgi:hypothetical protein
MVSLYGALLYDYLKFVKELLNGENNWQYNFYGQRLVVAIMSITIL